MNWETHAKKSAADFETSLGSFAESNDLCKGLWVVMVLDHGE